MKKAAKVILIAGAAIVCVAAFGFMKLRKPAEAVEELAPPTVKVETPQVGSLYLETEYIGSLEPAEMVTVIPMLTGEILSVNFEAGQMVNEGDVLCTINVDALSSYKISVDSAAINVQDAAKALERTTALYESGSVSQQVYEQAKTGYDMANLQYQQAKTTYDLQLKYSNVTAPISGMIETRNVDVHDMASPQSPICVITSKDSMLVSFQVSERVMKALRVGDSLTIDKSGSTYHGTITEISSMVNQQTGLFLIKASVEDGSSLVTGSTVKLHVTTDKAENVLLIPVDAVYYNNGEPFVYLYDNGTVQKASIETGLYDSSVMEVVSGLNADSQVITTWTTELTEGAAVLKAADQAETSEASGTSEASKTTAQAEAGAASETTAVSPSTGNN